MLHWFALICHFSFLDYFQFLSLNNCGLSCALSGLDFGKQFPFFMISSSGFIFLEVPMPFFVWKAVEIKWKADEQNHLRILYFTLVNCLLLYAFTKVLQVCLYRANTQITSIFSKFLLKKLMRVAWATQQVLWFWRRSHTHFAININTASNINWSARQGTWSQQQFWQNWCLMTF